MALGTKKALACGEFNTLSQSMVSVREQMLEPMRSG